tara:strand:+ start:2657 stop:3487 length:831 start_codon:yes stop_codon:yes gene_type:complete
MNTVRAISRRVRARPSSDGDGVKIQRIAGQELTALLDPFILLDEIHSEEGADYVGGFPAHPHRGFETVTYLLHGALRHEDHLGNVGRLGDGGVQWMTAGSGIVHAEMPEQSDGLFHGFQLWLNLPAAEKMRAPAYTDYSAADIPTVQAAGAAVKVIAGEYAGVAGPVAERTTQPLLLDVAVQPGQHIEIPVASHLAAAFYLYAGSNGEQQARELALFGPGELLRIEAGADGARGLVLAGVALREPVAQYGPFVMNTREQVEEAIQDYNNGRLTAHE